MSVFFFGEVDTVYAKGINVNGCWNHIISTLRSKNGMIATVEGSNNMSEAFPYSMKFRIIGDKGTLDHDFKTAENLDTANAVRETMYYRNGDKPIRLEIEEKDAFQTELEYFIECVVEDKEVVKCRPENSLYVLKVISAIKESLETGHVVDM